MRIAKSKTDAQDDIQLSPARLNGVDEDAVGNPNGHSPSHNPEALASEAAHCRPDVEPLPHPLAHPRLPRSSGDLWLDLAEIDGLLSSFSTLRSFGFVLRLAPFTLKELCRDISSKNSSPNLLDEIHTSVLRTLQAYPPFQEPDTEGVQILQRDGASYFVKDSILQLVNDPSWRFLDTISWPEFLRRWLTVTGTGSHLQTGDFFNSGDYWALATIHKVNLLRSICEDLLDSWIIREQLELRGKDREHLQANEREEVNMKKKALKAMQNDSGAGAQSIPEAWDHLYKREGLDSLELDVCDITGLGGTLMCCDGCPASYLARSVGVKKITNDDVWFCEECRVGGQIRSHRYLERAAFALDWADQPPVADLGQGVGGIHCFSAFGRVFVGNGKELFAYYSTSEKVESLINFFSVVEPEDIEANVSPRWNTPLRSRMSKSPDVGEEDPQPTRKRPRYSEHSDDDEESEDELPVDAAFVLKKKKKVLLDQMAFRAIVEAKQLAAKDYLNRYKDAPSHSDVYATTKPKDKQDRKKVETATTKKWSNWPRSNDAFGIGRPGLGSISSYLLQMERGLYGLVDGSFSKQTGRREWMELVEQADDVAELAKAALTLESAIRPIVFNRSWFTGGDKKASGKGRPKGKKDAKKDNEVDWNELREAGILDDVPMHAAPQEDDDEEIPRYLVWASGRKVLPLGINLSRKSLREVVLTAGESEVMSMTYKGVTASPSARLVWIRGMHDAKTAAQLAIQLRVLDEAIRADISRKPVPPSDTTTSVVERVVGKREVARGQVEYQVQMFGDDAKTDWMPEEAAPLYCIKEFEVESRRIAEFDARKVWWKDFDFHPGAAVEVESDGQWFEGYIVQSIDEKPAEDEECGDLLWREGIGIVRVHYIGGLDDEDEWLYKDDERLREDKKSEARMLKDRARRIREELKANKITDKGLRMQARLELYKERLMLREQEAQLRSTRDVERARDKERREQEKMERVRQRERRIRDRESEREARILERRQEQEKRKEESKLMKKAAREKQRIEQGKKGWWRDFNWIVGVMVEVEWNDEWWEAIVIKIIPPAGTACSPRIQAASNPDDVAMREITDEHNCSVSRGHDSSAGLEDSTRLEGEGSSYPIKSDREEEDLLDSNRDLTGELLDSRSEEMRDDSKLHCIPEASEEGKVGAISDPDQKEDIGSKSDESSVNPKPDSQQLNDLLVLGDGEAGGETKPAEAGGNFTASVNDSVSANRVEECSGSEGLALNEELGSSAMPLSTEQESNSLGGDQILVGNNTQCPSEETHVTAGSDVIAGELDENTTVLPVVEHEIHEECNAKMDVEAGVLEVDFPASRPELAPHSEGAEVGTEDGEAAVNQGSNHKIEDAEGWEAALGYMVGKCQGPSITYPKDWPEDGQFTCREDDRPVDVARKHRVNLERLVRMNKKKYPSLTKTSLLKAGTILDLPLPIDIQIGDDPPPPADPWGVGVVLIHYVGGGENDTEWVFRCSKRMRPSTEKTWNSIAVEAAEEMASLLAPDQGAWKKHCSRVVKRVRKSDKSWPFWEPVDPIKEGIEDYFDIIEKPMCLDMVDANLAADKYSTPQEFAEDMRLIFNNAMVYNPPDHSYHQLAEKMLALFEEQWATGHEENNWNQPYGAASCAVISQLKDTSGAAGGAKRRTKRMSGVNEDASEGCAKPEKARGKGHTDDEAGSALDEPKQDKPEKQETAKHIPFEKQRFTKSSRVHIKGLLDSLMGHELAKPFLEPVSQIDVPDYYTIIKKPMDLGTLLAMLNDRKCNTPAHFERSIRLIFQNARTYNGDDDPISKAANGLERMFERKWSRVLQKLQAERPQLDGAEGDAEAAQADAVAAGSKSTAGKGSPGKKKSTADGLDASGRKRPRVSEGGNGDGDETDEVHAGKKRKSMGEKKRIDGGDCTTPSVDRHDAAPRSSKAIRSQNKAVVSAGLDAEMELATVASGKKRASHGGDKKAKEDGEAEVPDGVAGECKKMVDMLLSARGGQYFSEPVDAESLGLTDYHEIVMEPMDLGTVRDKLLSGAYKPRRKQNDDSAFLAAFARDVRLVFDNAMLYNPETDRVFKAAASLRELFESTWASAAAPSQPGASDVHVEAEGIEESGKKAKKKVEEASRGRQRRPKWVTGCLEELGSLMERSEAVFFLEPVDAKLYGLPDYHRIIKQPMDLGTIRAALEDGSITSVDLVWANAMRYNPQDNPVHEAARLLAESRAAAHAPAASSQERAAPRTPAPTKAKADTEKTPKASEAATPAAKEDKDSKEAPGEVHPVGTRVEMLFADGVWYQGTIERYSARSGRYTITFPDGDVQTATLPDPEVRILGNARHSKHKASTAVHDDSPAPREVSGKRAGRSSMSTDEVQPSEMNTHTTPAASAKSKRSAGDADTPHAGGAAHAATPAHPGGQRREKSAGASAGKKNSSEEAEPPLATSGASGKKQSSHGGDKKAKEDGEAEVPDGVAGECKKMVDMLLSARGGQYFSEPVDAESLGLTDYHEIVMEPMDLGTVRDKLLSGAYKPRRKQNDDSAFLAAFARDVRLVFDNAMLYNPETDRVFKAAASLRELFDSKWSHPDPAEQTPARPNARTPTVLSVESSTKAVAAVAATPEPGPTPDTGRRKQRGGSGATGGEAEAEGSAVKVDLQELPATEDAVATARRRSKAPPAASPAPPAASPPAAAADDSPTAPPAGRSHRSSEGAARGGIEAEPPRRVSRSSRSSDVCEASPAPPLAQDLPSRHSAPVTPSPAAPRANRSRGQSAVVEAAAEEEVEAAEEQVQAPAAEAGGSARRRSTGPKDTPRRR